MYFFIIGLIISFLFCILFFLGYNDSLSSIYTLILLFIVGYIILYLCYTWQNNKRISEWGLRPSYICLIGLLIVNLQFFFDEVYFNIKISDLINIGWVNQYFDKCLIGGGIFIITFLMANSLIKKIPKFNFKLKSLPIKPWLILQFSFFILFLINIDLASFLTGEIYHGSGDSSTEGGLASSFERFYDATSLITLALYTQQMTRDKKYVTIIHYFKNISLLFWIPFFLYLILRLFSGDRGPVIYCSLSIMYSYTLISHKFINLKLSLCLIFIGAFGVSLLGIVRSRSSELSFTEKIEQSLIKMDEKSSIQNQSFSPLTQELAASLRCNMIAVKAIENDEVNYTFGKFTLLSCIASFPGARREYFESFGLSEEDFSSAIYLTQLYNRSKSFYFGIGSSVFAEGYLDLNIWGVIIVALILGYTFKLIDLSFQTKEPLPIIWLIIVIRLSAMAIYVSRTSLSQLVGLFLSIIIIYYIFNPFFRIIRRIHL